MQLKRDTDYALRVVHSLKRAYEADGEDLGRGLTLTEISAQAGVPKAAASRICAVLGRKGIVRSMPRRRSGDQVRFFAGDLSGYSLLDLIEAVEGTSRVFAVFDKRSLMYRRCEGRLQAVQEAVTRALSEATVESLL